MDDAMHLSVKFFEGPMHGKYGLVNQLPQHQIFFDSRQKQVIVYVRSDELAYTVDVDLSHTLTDRYEETSQRLAGGTGNSVVKWLHKTFA